MVLGEALGVLNRWHRSLMCSWGGWFSKTYEGCVLFSPSWCRNVSPVRGPRCRRRFV